MASKRYKLEPRSWMAKPKFFGLLLREDIWKHPTNAREEAELIAANWQHKFIARIHEANIYRELTTDDSGEVLGVEADTVARILNGSRPLDIVEYILLAKEFEITIEI